MDDDVRYPWLFRLFKFSSQKEASHHHNIELFVFEIGVIASDSFVQYCDGQMYSLDFVLIDSRKLKKSIDNFFPLMLIDAASPCLSFEFKNIQCSKF